jgi:hypothetical protein
MNLVWKISHGISSSSVWNLATRFCESRKRIFKPSKLYLFWNSAISRVLEVLIEMGNDLITGKNP